MTSRVSFRKILKEDMHRRFWLFILTLAVGFLILPILTFSRINMTLKDIEAGYGTLLSARESIQSFMSELSGCSSVLMTFGAFIAAMIAVVSGYSWLNSQEQVDIWHSFPVSRQWIRNTTDLSSVLLCVVPYIINQLLAVILVPAVTGVLSGDIVTDGLKAMLLFILEFLAVYFIAEMGMMLSGRTGIGILLACLILFYIPAVSLVIGAYIDTCFDTLIASSMAVGMDFSPVTLLLQETDGQIAYRTALILLLVMAVLGCLIGRIIYERRPSEAAGNAVTFDWLRPVIKIIVIIPGSLGIAIILSSIMVYSGVNKVLLVAAAIVSAVIIDMVVELIFTGSLRSFQKNWKSLLAGIASVLCIVIFFAADPFGINSYLPEKSEIAEMAYYNPSASLSAYGSVYQSDSVYVREDSSYLSKKMEKYYTADYEPIYDFVTEAAGRDLEEVDADCQVTIGYRLKNGKTVIRQYFITMDEEEAIWDACKDDEDFLMNNNPVMSLDASDYNQITLIDGDYSDSVDLNLSEEETEELVECLKQDSINYTPFELNDEQIIAYIDLSEIEKNNADSETTDYAEVYLYQGYDNTWSLLSGLSDEKVTKLVDSVMTEDS